MDTHDRDAATTTAALRGLLGAIADVLAGGALVLWMATTPQVRTLGRDVALDTQAVLVLAATAVGVAALVTSWSVIGRALVAPAGAALAGQGVLVTVMSLGGLGIAGRTGGPTPVSVWPILAAMFGTVAVVVVAGGVTTLVVPRRRQVAGTALATVLGLTAVGIPAIPLTVAGPASSPAMTVAGPFVARATLAVLVAMVALAGLRRRRMAAIGQGVAALVILGAGPWLQGIAGAPTGTTSQRVVVAVLVAAAATAWAVLGGGGSPGQDHAEGDGDGRSIVAWDRTTTAVLPAVGAGATTATVDPTAAQAVPDHPVADPRRTAAEDPDPTDPTLVVDPTISIEP